MQNPAQNQISQEMKEKIVKALQERGVDQPCSRCQNRQFTLADGYFIIPLQSQFQGLVIGGPAIPAVVVFCTKCGNVNVHALGALGLMPETAPAKVTQK